MRALPQPKKPIALDVSLAIVNIVLLLIFFFLATGQLLNPPSADVELAETSELPLDQLPSPVLVVVADGSWELDGQAVAPDLLEVALEPLERPLTLHILINRAAPATSLIGVMNRPELADAELRLVTVRTASCTMTLRPHDKPIHWAEALGLSAAVHVGAIYLLFNFTVDLDRLIPEQPPERPDLLITSLVLDTQALVSATNQTAGIDDAEEIDAANEMNDGATVDPETLDPVTPDENIPDAVDPEDTVEEVAPDVDVPEDIAEPEAVAEVETPDTAPEVDAPEDVAAIAEDPETIEGTDAVDAPDPDIAPEDIAAVDQAGDQTPDPISPLQPQVPELSAAGSAPLGNAPNRLAAVAPSTSASPERLAPRAPGIGTISAEAVAAAAARPVRSLPTAPPPAPGTPEAVVSELVSRIRSNLSDTCLIAIPQMAANGAPELVIVTASEADVAPYASAVLDGIEPRPGQRSVLLDPRQCAVLDYVRQNRSYPAFRMSFGLAEDQIDSGEQLTGAVGGTAGRYVSLIMIDDNGVVQDLGQYLTFEGDDARFDVPMRRAGSARDTKQLLVAIGTNSRPASVDAQNGQLATDYFEALNAEVGTNVPIVMLPFDVR